jgi:putative endonuclease
VATRTELGRWGEQLAADHLAAEGFEVLDRNWRCRAGELDIVARDGETIVFCEVKTRSVARYGTPAEAITRLKARRLRRLAGCWLSAHAPRAGAVRLDVLSVLAPPGRPVVVEHLRGVC